MELFPKLKQKLNNSTRNYNSTFLSNAMLGLNGPMTGTRQAVRGQQLFKPYFKSTTRTQQTPRQTTRSTPRVNYQTGYTGQVTPPVSTNQSGQGNLLTQSLASVYEPGNDLDKLYREEYDNLSSYYNPLYDYEKEQYNLMADNIRNQMDSYLAESNASLEQDRSKLDTDAGSKGYAFSQGIREGQRGKLQDSYNRDINAKRNAYSTQLGQGALDLEYKLGSNALNNMNFSLANGRANAMSNTPSLVRSSNSVYNNNHNFTGRYVDDRGIRAGINALDRLNGKRVVRGQNNNGISL